MAILIGLYNDQDNSFKVKVVKQPEHSLGFTGLVMQFNT